MGGRRRARFMVAVVLVAACAGVVPVPQPVGAEPSVGQYIGDLEAVAFASAAAYCDQDGRQRTFEEVEALPAPEGVLAGASMELSCGETSPASGLFGSVYMRAVVNGSWSGVACWAYWDYLGVRHVAYAVGTTNGWLDWQYDDGSHTPNPQVGWRDVSVPPGPWTHARAGEVWWLDSSTSCSGDPGPVWLTRDERELRGRLASAAYAGDPVNTATGNFVDTVVDLDFPVDGLEWSRTYNSRGGEWSASLGRSSTEDAGGDVTFVLADGRYATFVASNGSYARPEGIRATLVKEDVGAFSLHFDDGAVERYVAGALVSVETWDGQRVTLTYDGGVLASAAHDAGHALSFTYDAGRLVRVQASDGRAVAYEWTDGRLTSVIDAAGGVWAYAYDARGRLSRVVDPDGVVVVDNTYNATGRVMSQRTPSGDTVEFSYALGSGRTTVSRSAGSTTYAHDRAGRLTSVTDSRGATMSATYDTAGNLVAMADRRGALVTQTFDGHGNVRTRLAPEGVLESFAYDPLDRLETATNGEGEVTRFVYEGEERLPSTVIDGNGKATVFDVGPDGLVRSTTDADGVTLVFGYDAGRRLTTVTDGRGDTSFGYDAAGNRTSMSTPAGRSWSWSFDGLRRLLSSTDPSGATVGRTWTPGGRLASRTDAEHHTTSFAYDTAGRLSAVTDALGRVTSYGHDADGNVTSVARPGGSVWSATYDGLGRRTSATDPTGVATSFGFDGDGNVASTREGDRVHDLRGRLTSMTDRLGHVTRYAYDRADRVTSVTDALGEATSYGYDDAGQLTTTTAPGGRVWRNTYTDAGRLRAMTDPNGHTTTYAYDELGRRESATDAVCCATVYAYDDDGRLVSVTSPMGLATTYTYDDVQRRVTVDPPGAGPTARTFTARGQVAEVDEPATDPVRFAYDATGALASATDALGRASSFGYDGRGNVTSRTNAAGGVDRWTYDLADRPLSHTDPMGHVAAATYDGVGRLATLRDASGRTVTYGYDDADRRMIEDWASGPRITATYDDVGRLTSMSDGSSTSAWSWNAVGELVSSTSEGRTVGHGYDLAGNRTSLTFPDGSVATFGYDADDRLASVSHPQAGTVSYFRDTDGRVTAEELPEGVSRMYFYDEGALSLYNEMRSGVSRATTLERDDAGRIVGETTAGVRTGYAYDAAGQLTAVERPGGASARTTIAYDAIGNRDLVTTGSVVDDYSHDAAGRLVSVTRRETPLLSLTTRFAYDDAGRLTSEIGPGGLASDVLAYDGRGLLATQSHAENGTITVTERLHDPAGQLAALVRTDVLATRTTELDWDQSQPVHQLAASRVHGGADTDYLHGTSRAVAVRGGQPDVFAEDAFGSTVAIGAAADLAVGVAYDAFGNAVRGSVASGPSGLFGYRGELTVEGLVHLRSRDYQPSVGRFTTADPLPGVPGEVTVGNPYHYVDDDPLDVVDPLGLSPLRDDDVRWWSFLARSGGAFLGGFVGQAKGVVAASPFVQLRSWWQEVDAVRSDWRNGGVGVAIGNTMRRGLDRNAAIGDNLLAPVLGWQLVNVAIGARSPGEAWEGYLHGAGALTFDVTVGSAIARAGAGAEAVAPSDAVPTPQTADDLARAAAARDAAGQQLGRKHATYAGGTKDGRVVVGCSTNPIGCAEDDIARQLGPDAQMTNAFGWRRNPATGQLEWTEIPLCTRCQGKYGPDQFPSDVQAESGGAWGRR